MPTPSTGTGPGFDSPLPPGGATLAGRIDVTNISDPATRSFIVSQSQQADQASSELTATAAAYKAAADRLAQADPSDINYAALVRNADSLANTWAASQNNYSRALEARASSIQKAIDNRWIQGAQQELWQAQATNDKAQAAKANSDVQIAQGNAGPQRDLLIAQSTATTAQAAFTNAQANNLSAKTPAEISQLQASANQANANAAALNAQAGKTAAETRVTEANAAVAPRAAEATTGTLEAQAQQARAQAGVAPRAAEATTGTLEAQRGVAEQNLANMPSTDLAQATNVAQTAQQQAAAAQGAANVGKTVLGPAFGLQQQVDAIKQIADHMRNGGIPLGTDPSSAIQNMNDMLNRYLQATLGGTTVAAASQQAQQAQENLRQQDITQRQQDTTLQGQGMSGAASAFGSAISPLIGAVKDLPAGSTALGPAAAAMFAPFLAAAGGGLVKPPASVAAPALPPFLQNFTAPQAAASPAGSPGHSITINIGGSGANAPAQQSSTPGGIEGGQPMGGNQDAALPSFLQGSQVATPDFVDQLKQDTLGKIGSWMGGGSNLAGATPSADWAAG